MKNFKNNYKTNIVIFLNICKHVNFIPIRLIDKKINFSVKFIFKIFNIFNLFFSEIKILNTIKFI